MDHQKKKNNLKNFQKLPQGDICKVGVFCEK